MEPEQMRASDADRDKVAELLREALAEGRITHDEHEERLDVLYRAKTIGELAPLTQDLPAPGHASREFGSPGRGIPIASEEALDLAQQSTGSENLVAVFGGVERKGRWLVEPRTNVSVLFGGVDLDLREAVLSRREITVQCAVIFGGLDIIVPHGVRVVNTTSAIFGGADLHGTDQITEPNAPTIRLTGTCMFGGISVKAKAPKRRRRGRQK